MYITGQPREGAAEVHLAPGGGGREQLSRVRTISSSVGLGGSGEMRRDQPRGVHPDLQAGGVAVPPAMTDTAGQKDTTSPEKAEKEVKFLPSYFILLSHQTCGFVVAKQSPIS